MGFCDTCQQETVWEDLTTGTYCTACGGEISALNFDESAEWIESGNGSAHQAGTTIATGSTGASALRGLAGAQSESRPQTIARAKRAVEELADKMQMNSLKRDAEGLIEMAVNNYFTKGRKKMLVAAACLYAVSRRSNSAVLLIDFAEQLGCDVFSIGRTFIELCHTMTLDIPPIEPYFYIRRFCTQLGFGKETKDVQNTAHKLIACMNRDWMSHGRRPAGICAIAILISARMHKFSITQEEVANVSRLCSATISKRYQEFQQTQVANMSLDEFEKHVSQLNNPEYKRQYKESDPPAFSKSKAEQFAEIMASMDKIQQEMNARKGVEKPAETAPPPVEKTSEKAVAPDEEEIVMSTEDEEEVDVGRLEDLEDAELLHYLVNNMNDQRTRDQMFEQEYGAHIREMEKKKQEKLERLAEQGDKPRRKRKLKEEHTDVATQSLAEAAASTRKKEMIMSRGHALQPFVPSNYAITPDMEPLSEVDDAYNELSSNRDDGFDHYFENIDTTLSRPKKRARLYDDDEYL